jgi:hypothetical protein
MKLTGKMRAVRKERGWGEDGEETESSDWSRVFFFSPITLQAKKIRNQFLFTEPFFIYFRCKFFYMGNNLLGLINWHSCRRGWPTHGYWQNVALSLLVTHGGWNTEEGLKAYTAASFEQRLSVTQRM